MPSRRYRSRNSLGTRLNKIRYSVSKTENTSIPSVVGNNAVNTYSLTKNAVGTDYMTTGAVDSTTYSLSSYLPGGETNQRVPAPLNDTIYWGQVVEGRIELHQSGIHGDGELEDIQNVSADVDGLIFNPTNGAARIYLTGRLDLPKSRKIYSTWDSDLSIPIQLIYWEDTPEYFVESAYKTNGITHLDLSNTSHTLAVGDLITVTQTTDDFDGLYRVVEVKADYVSAVMYQQRYTLTVDDSAYSVSTNTVTFTLNGENPTTTVIKPNDLVVLSSVAGYTSLAGPHRILTVDDTTTANTIVLTFSGSYSADVNDFYNTLSATVYTGTETDTVNQQNFSPLGIVSEDIYHYIQLENKTVWGADGYTFPITQASLLNGRVTITTPYAHYASIGDTITVNGLDASTGQTGLFDNNNAYITSVNASAKTITYRTYDDAIPTNSYGPTSNTADAIAVTHNQYTARQYAVYAEEPLGNIVKTLYTAKVFEVLGEPSVDRKYFDITYLNTNASPYYVTLNAPLDPVPTSITLSFNDTAINNDIGGTWTVSSVTGNDVYFTTGSYFPPSYNQSTTGELTYTVGVRSYELTPDGLVFYDPSGGVDTRLGSIGQDEITLANASINVAGVASVTSLYTGAVYSSQPSFFSANTTFNSEVKIYSTQTNTTNNLYGTADLARYHDLSNSTTNSPYTQIGSISSYTGDILNRFARGLIYSVNYGALFDSDGTKTATADRYTWAAGTFIVDPDRNYLFVISTGDLRVTTATNATSRIEFIASSNATATGNYALNTIASNNAVYIKQAINMDQNYKGPVHPMMFEYTSTSSAVTNGISNYLVQSGVEIFWQLRYAYGSTAHTDAVLAAVENGQSAKYGVSIYDMGPSTVAQIGSATSGEGKWLSTGSFATAGYGASTTITASASMPSANSVYYDGYGRGSFNDYIYQGDPSGSKVKDPNTVRKSHITFPAISTIVGAAYSYTNFTITKIEVYLKNRHSYSSGGLSAKIGYTDVGGNPGTTIAAATNLYTPASFSFAKTEGKYVTLPSAWYSAINSTGTWGILLGLIDDDPDTYDDTLSNYGYFDGTRQTDPPQARVTYTYTV